MSRNRTGALVVLGAALLLGACTRTPSLNALIADSGPERSLVEIDGDGLFGTKVVWDAGLATETELPGGFLGGYMFTVPQGASTGPHPVAVRNGSGTSGTATFTVTAPEPIGGPRVDRVSLLGTSFDGAGNVTPWYYVQGPNIDVGAVVEVDGSDVATVAHRGLQMETYGIDPTVLGYPIDHYLSLIAVGDPGPVGSSVSIRVRNLDGTFSTGVAYALPTDELSVDHDGDDIPTAWELNGYDADGDGVVDVDLEALGAHPGRPDLLVEVDVMTGLTNPPIASVPGTPGTFETCQAMFAAAPILNPIADPGINLILDTSGTVPYSAEVGFAPILPAPAGGTEFSGLKATNFDNGTRDRLFHYCIWADMMPGQFSGVSDVEFGGSESGDDFLVSFDSFPNSYQTRRSQVETFCHELGHDLGQRHGGDTHSRFKPNYWSAMTYNWQLRSGQTNATRRNRVTCTPVYWADPTAVEVNGVPPAVVNAIVDYSHGMGPTLVENNGSLQEGIGVCGFAVDWNNDGDATDTNLSVDADDNGASNETLFDFSNWAAIDFTGPRDDGDVTP